MLIVSQLAVPMPRLEDFAHLGFTGYSARLHIVQSSLSAPTYKSQVRQDEGLSFSSHSNIVEQ